MILSGDVGGTKTHVALYKNNQSQTLFREKTYASNDYSSFAKVLEDFLKDVKEPIVGACFGIAGPIKNQRCQATNLPWVIDAKELSIQFSIPKVYLINDLEANAYGLSCLSPKEFYVLNEGRQNLGNAALISAGTGLGEAGLFWDGSKHIPFACEGGHSDFAPQDDLQIDLFEFLQKKYGHVSYERVVSGMGIQNIYEFLAATKRIELNESLENEMKKSDPARIITEKAMKKEIEGCEKTLDIFMSIYGAEAGNAALKYLAVSGIYLGGGIAPKILSLLKEGIFMRSFIKKGRFASLMKDIPVKIVLNDKAALLGARRYVLEKIKKPE
ncbi:MAG TPA: glucokinase [Chlamydiales bacterium]|nr:glucokinase [Chlamydiales bacterium]